MFYILQVSEWYCFCCPELIYSTYECHIKLIGRDTVEQMILDEFRYHDTMEDRDMQWNFVSNA